MMTDPIDPAFSHSIPNLHNKKVSLSELASHPPIITPFPFSGVIAFQKEGEPIVEATHCPNQAAFSLDQPFNTLSVGKLFTATAVMQLIEEGAVTLGSTLFELLTPEELDLPLAPPYSSEKPDGATLKTLSEHGKSITLRHLLTHTAGFVHTEESREKEDWKSELFGKYAYSNFGFQLLATIVGKYSPLRNSSKTHEENFRNHVIEKIFKPACMEGALREIQSPTTPLDRHEITEEGKFEVVDEPEPYPHGNGCWRMPAKDLLKFHSALHENFSLIQRESLTTMLQESLGFMSEKDPDTQKIVGYGHPGGGPGMSSFMHTWCTDPPITAVAVSNFPGCDQIKPELDKILQQ